MQNNPTVAEESDDSRSEAGDMFQSSSGNVQNVLTGMSSTVPRNAQGVGAAGQVRRQPQVARVVGRGPVPVDKRKFRYDTTRALTMPKLGFGASRADRMDAEDAGAMLDRLHQMVGIDRDTEDVIAAFDKALFFEHTVNGASLLQPGRGVLRVGESLFEIAGIKTMLGVDQRRFFRAFADDIVIVNREVLSAYDAHDPVAVEKHGQIMQVAIERGLQKYPYLAHDSSDAGVRLSVEERAALVVSKRTVLESVVNRADAPVRRVDEARVAGKAAYAES